MRHFMAGEMGIIRRPSRMVGITFFSIKPSFFALSNMLTRVRLMLPSLR